MGEVLGSLGGWLHDVFVARFDVWVIIGLFAQAMFSMRFIIQWLASERARRSVMPIAFWFFSIGGGALLFTYALHLKDPVFIIGQGMGLFIYSRNLWLIRRERRELAGIETSR